MKLYLGCQSDHVPPLDVDAPNVRACIAANVCPVCPAETLQLIDADAGGWMQCACCDSAWKLEYEGFACRPGRIIEEWE